MNRASILAIGTELTQGQITNRNAAWISERLTDLGLETTSHITVPDDRARIRASLESAAAENDLLIVTGGLGPTSDDFTREVLAEWWGSPLEFVSGAWEKIVRRLTERGIEVAESNRSQCFFPIGATVLENLEGTADGFRFRRIAPNGRATEVVALPGPPREIAHLWERFISAWLTNHFTTRKADRETWHCLGKSESSLGEIVEGAVAGFGVQTGYRASMPYVEVKIWIPPSLSPERRGDLLDRMNEALAPYSVARNGEDLAERFAATILDFPEKDRVTLLDLGSAGRLAERAIAMLRSERAKPLRERTEILTRLPADGSPIATAADFPEFPSEWFFVLFPNGEVAVAGPRGKRVRALANPYPNPALAERLGGYRAEMALKSWCELVAELRAGSDTPA